MKLLFLGLLYNRNDEAKLLSMSKVGLQNATNSYQWSLLDGLDEILNEPVQIYSYLPIGTYPKHFRKLFLPTSKWSHRKNSEDLELGFINVPVLKQLYRYYAMKRRVKLWCQNNKTENQIILAYSLYLPYLMLLAKMKKKFPKLSVTIIVTDLPNAFGFPDTEPAIRIWIKKYLEKLQYRYLKSMDSYVLLTRAMADRLDIRKKPFVVVEGICPSKLPHEICIETGSDTILMYAGNLDQRYGMDKLIAAFRNLNLPNLKLWFCGTGDYVKEIEIAAQEDPRIIYWGYLAHEEIHLLQAQATLLVNPRPDEEEYTRYSFPSKTLDYMSSGRPVLCFKLEGIPKEYDDYLYYILENTVNGIEEAITRIKSKSKEELDNFGANAKSFVLDNKNGRIQAEKILSLLNKPTRRVLQINITCGYGSTGRLALDIQKELLDKGWESNLAYSVHPPKPKGFSGRKQESSNSTAVSGTFPIETRFENYLRRGLNRYVGRKYIHSAPGTIRLIRNIRKLKPDIIHLHNIQQNSIHFPMLLRFLKAYGVPVVYTLHDCWAFTGGCYYFTSYQCSGYQNGCKTCIHDKEKDWDICNQSAQVICQEKSRALHGLKRLQIICVSEWLKSCALQSFLRDLPLSVIYNGIDTSVFRPIASELRGRHGIREEEFVILGVANVWDQRKRLDTFLELAKVIDKSYRIVLIGITPDRCPENVIAVPRTEDIRELACYYSCADVFINASREETFGLTTAEAMACGTPVIVYESTACAEIVTESTGVVMHNDSNEELLKAIEEVKGKGKLAYRDYCTERIRTNYSKEMMLKNYLELYDKLLQK